MPDLSRHESADLTDYEVLDSCDTLAGDPGDDPLDRGIVAPQRWSAAMRFGSTAAEQRAGSPLEQRLNREVPDSYHHSSDDGPDGAWDEQSADGDGASSQDGYLAERTGRLVRVAADGAVFISWETGVVARDMGADGGGAAAEEAAVHITDDSHAGFPDGQAAPAPAAEQAGQAPYAQPGGAAPA